ncbi:cobalamin-independent methionine synthase catalytic subunit [Nocardiopsis sp. Huas11]|uniref:methionine synthase n=1 Tax=Nocardiopsis sp. Huas11 TaxID=2183912 RepID=UPI000EB5B018|nr:methionine synthase [Nocardiopsis sp. Huas11]RKS10766.1 cobalamin-independent methionine synthase catalytic subunit [Nocardiopsis sp. Huas11]
MTEQQLYPWPDASYTGVGSWPGEDPDEAVRTIIGELPDLPHLPELPDRGVGADMIGRTAGLLVDFPVEVQPSAWRVADTPGRDIGRATSLMSYDLDALTEHAHTYTGTLKIQVAGPWTLAASIELRNGQRLASDPGACRDLAESHREGVLAHLAEVRRRVPGARVIVQVDEPSLPAVLLGSLPTASGFGRVRAVDRVDVESALRQLFIVLEDAGAVPAVHCCATGAPIDLLRRSGARALSLNALLLTREHDEMIGTAVEAGVGLLLGVVPTTEAPPARPSAESGATTARGPQRSPKMSDAAATVDPVRELWNRLGITPDLLSRAVVTTPTCGLAGATPGYARAALDAVRDGARVLRDEPRR